MDGLPRRSTKRRHMIVLAIAFVARVGVKQL